MKSDAAASSRPLSRFYHARFPCRVFPVPAQYVGDGGSCYFLSHAAYPSSIVDKNE